MTSEQRGRYAAWLACAGLGVTAVPAMGQCPNLRWTAEFSTPEQGLATATGRPTGSALRVFDPVGPGPAELYVGGHFIRAGPVVTQGLARWDGRRWAEVAGGVTLTGEAARVTGLALHDADGQGPLPPVLIVGGAFDRAGGVPADGIAAWDGVSWSALGSGIGADYVNVAMVDFDEDGPGPMPPSLIVSNGGPIRRWNGTVWSVLPGGSWGAFALAVFDEDGPGPAAPALFAGVDYPQGVYKWDGLAWSAVGGGLRSAVHTCGALAVIDEDGPGPGREALFAGGNFMMAGSVHTTGIARWDGQEWSAVGQGIPGQVEDIVAIDDTSGAGAPTIYAAANLNYGIHRWDRPGTRWEQIGLSNAQFGIWTLHRLEVFDEDGTGPGPAALYYTAPWLSLVSGTQSLGIARYGCACYANCDGSAGTPALNVNDFVCFLQRFAAGEPYADCDYSGSLNVNDFVCFQGAFAAGCP